MSTPISLTFENVQGRPKMKVLRSTRRSSNFHDRSLKQDVSVHLEALYNAWIESHPDVKVNQIYFHNDLSNDDRGTECLGQVIILFSVDEGLEETVEST